MDLLTLAVLCGPLVASATTLRVIQVESAGHFYSIHDNSDGRSYDLALPAGAIQVAETLIRAGHRLDVGLMQINYEVWLKPSRVALNDAFDPCTNVRFGTSILSAAYGRALPHSASTHEALLRALSVYNSGDELAARAYAQKILGAVPLNDLRRTGSRAVVESLR